MKRFSFILLSFLLTAGILQAQSVSVVFSNDTATVTADSIASQYLTVTQSGAHVSIEQSSNLATEITYTLSGSSSDGEFYMSGSYKATLEFNGLTLTNTTPVYSGAAVHIQNGKRINVKVITGTTNTLVDAASGSQKGCLYIKGHAEAKKQAMVLEAEGIKANGEAEAYKIQKAGEAEAIAIEKKGLAEAEAMQKKAEAYERYGQAAILDMMVKIIPEVAQHVSEPISAIKNMNVYGTSGADAAGISGAVPTVIKQSFDVIESATGVNMTDIVRANTIDAKVNRNINLDSDSKVDVKK